MNSSLQIHLFGAPRVLLNDAPVPGFPTEKVKLLFYYLVLFHRTVHIRAYLVGTFWGDCPEPRARHSFSTALWRLRSWLEPLEQAGIPFLMADEGQVGFNPSSTFWLDTREFEDCCIRARTLQHTAPSQAAVLAQQAITFYQGDLLQGCYADWCLAEREHLHQLYLDALTQLLAYHGSHSDYTQAINMAIRILHEDPLREEIQRELIKLYVLNHQTGQAIEQYCQFQILLRRELGIEPLPETRRLFGQVLEGEKGMHDASVNTFTMPNTALDLKRVTAHVERLLTELNAMHDELLSIRSALAQVTQAP